MLLLTFNAVLRAIPNNYIQFLMRKATFRIVFTYHQPSDSRNESAAFREVKFYLLNLIRKPR